MKILKLLILIFAICSSVYPQWQQQNTPDNTTWYFDLEAISQTTVYCAGGKMLKTVNGGTTWSPLTIAGYTSTVWGISFYNSSTGWGCGFTGKIFKTENGGGQWSTVTVGTEAFRDILFVNQSTGLVCGDIGRLYKSTNGGANWTAKNPGTTLTLRSIANYNSNWFWMGGGDGSEGVIVRSTNGGDSWSTMQTFDRPIEKIQFVNSTTGFASSDSRVYKSTNSGVNWVDINLPTSGYFLTFHMANANIGYASNWDNTYKTMDGGATWFEQNTVLPNTSMNDIEFAPGSTSVGWMCGTDGAMVYTNNSGGGAIGIEPISGNVPDKYSLSQNYPNPFNPSTNIKLQIARSGFVKLTVYDVSGKESAVLVNENLAAGEYEVDFNASKLTSGVYFYRLESKDFTEVKKMVLVK
ncbi:MAG TPA: YCF48-related protein [Ignavibacteria bacterium]|nr:YCF48-related protein [Ignavibacteria bacterium]HMQ98364.1 YCF48-related protein [Ignavibacteria bacterium]